MNKRWMTWSVLGALATAGLGFAGARALATGAPQLSPLTYGGVLTDKDGKPYPSVQEVVLKFYDKVDATAAKCVAPAALAEAGTGRFSVVLPGECAQAVRDSPDLWSEATVGGGKTVLPRVHVRAVPYALEADSAKVAAGATGALKAAVDGVVADVAALKKAPAGGGAPKVVDGAGVVLGTPFEIGVEVVGLVTPKGYSVRFYLSGNYLQESIGYSSNNCTGAPFRVVNSLGLEMLPNLITFNSGILYATVGSLSYKLPSGSSKTEKGGCFKHNSVVDASVAELKVVTPQEIGLPDKITAPLKIVP